MNTEDHIEQMTIVGGLPSVEVDTKEPPNKLALVFDNVTFEARSVHGESFCILHKLNFQIAQGEFLALVGPSGCGKTTSLTLAAGFAQPTSGQILRIDAEGNPTGRGPVMCFQSDTVFAHMTVLGNLRFAMRRNHNTKHSAPLDWLLSALGLSQFSRFYPKELSGGMRKRVELGRGWLASNRNGMLLLDECLSGLDSITRIEMQALLQQLWMDEPRAIAMVTHDLEEALMLASRILVMHGPPGHIVSSFDVPFARPREQELRYTTEFQRLRQELHQLLVHESK